jgi:hypothetical protein
MAQYILRKGKQFYELAKFEDSDDSTAVYKFTQRGCTCPAGRRSCKHTKILTAWKLAGEIAGFVYDDEANHIGTLNVV